MKFKRVYKGCYETKNGKYKIEQNETTKEWHLYVADKEERDGWCWSTEGETLKELKELANRKEQQN